MYRNGTGFGTSIIIRKNKDPSYFLTGNTIHFRMSYGYHLNKENYFGFLLHSYSVNATNSFTSPNQNYKR
jgi:hypothetical protein